LARREKPHLFGSTTWKISKTVKISILWELRGFVVEWCATRRWKGFCANLSNRIKFLDKNWFFAFWSLLQYMYQNRSFSCFQDVQMDDCQKYKWFRGLSKSIDKNHKFWFLNYKYDEVTSQKILSVYDNFKWSVREIRGGGPTISCLIKPPLL
jgi:hypothetical protein